MLNQEEEQEYAKRYRDHQDMQAAQYLVLSNLRFVVYVAKFSRLRLAIIGHYPEGNVGLMRAVNKYDPDQGFALFHMQCTGCVMTLMNTSLKI